MTEQFQLAFVLNRREHSETSLIVDCFSEKFGRISLLAKGARRPKSSLKALLQPFTLLHLQWTGKSDLKTLTKAESISTLPMETMALYSGFYVNEVLSRVVEKQTPYPDLFHHYLQCLMQLASQPEHIEPTLRTFEFHVLQALGYGIDFAHCAATGDPVVPEMTYQFAENQGFIASLLQNNLSFLGEDLLAFAQLDFSQKSTQQAAKRFTRIALKPYLGTAPLKSRELFQSILPHRLKGQ